MTAERHKRHWSSPANDDPISWQLLRFLNRFPLPEMKAASFRCFQSWDFVAMLTLGLKPKASSGEEGRGHHIAQGSAPPVLHLQGWRKEAHNTWQHDPRLLQ